MTNYTLAFVNTATNYADYGTAPYSLGEGYPTTRSSLTFGVVDSNGNASTLNTADFSSPTTPLLSGRIASTSNAKVIRVDLPSGAGTYRVRCALGTRTSATTCGMRLYDAADGAHYSHTPLLTVPDTSGAANNFIDIKGNLHTEATWSANQGYEELTLPATVYIAKGTSAALHLANIQFEYAPVSSALDEGQWGVNYQSSVSTTAANGTTVTGLPDGLTGNVSNGILTISGVAQ